MNTLFRKLALVLFLLLCITGGVLFYLVSYATDMYQNEANQKLNATLAEHIIAEDLLIKNGEIDKGALKHVIHMLMVINPSIEVYLLDLQGKILGYSAPEGKVKRTHINMSPVNQFLTPDVSYPLFGDDPRNLGTEKIFSVAQIPPRGNPEGYLYVILASEAFDSVGEMLKNSYIARYSLIGISVCLFVILLAGLLSFALLTRRLTLLSDLMGSYLTAGKSTQPRYIGNKKSRDEIESLGETFNIMADRIEAQVNELRNNDAKRRELIANVSHDLRTPLTSLHGYLETLQLKEDSLTQEERRNYIETATSHSERLTQLVTELFELAKLDSVETLLNVEPFSLGELVQDVKQKFDLRAQEKSVKIVTDFGMQLPFAYGDIGLMQRVLENLIDNALRYTTKGGLITISLAAEGEHICVKVSDTGCGIPKEEIPHIFDRFYRLQKSRKDESSNSGLGLAIAKRIIALHGSQIWADSRLNMGTTFTFNIPLKPALTHA